MKKMMTFIFLLLSTSSIYSQRILGGDLIVDSQLPNNFTQAYVTIHRENLGQPEELHIDWGDGTIDVIDGYTASTMFEDVVADIYYGEHWYETGGLYNITVRDSFLVEDIVNIENSGEQIFELKNSLKITDSGVPSVTALFLDSGLLYEIEPTGAVSWHGLFGFSTLMPFDSVVQRLIPFVEEGYSLPPVSDTIICCRPLVWDRPVAPGRYAFAIDMTTWKNGEIIGNSMRKMTIHIDSSMLVSSYTPLVEGILSVYPNPASEKLRVQWGGFTPGKAELSLLDVHGREWHRQAIGLGAAVQTLEVEVSAWPPGLYVLRLQAGDAVWSRKVLVE